MFRLAHRLNAGRGEESRTAEPEKAFVWSQSEYPPKDDGGGMSGGRQGKEAGGGQSADKSQFHGKSPGARVAHHADVTVGDARPLQLSCDYYLVYK